MVETGADAQDSAGLVYRKVGRTPVRLVLAVPPDYPIQGPKELEGKRIATEVVGMTERYLAEHGVKADIEFSWGATEVKPPRLADAIVEITETGSSLRANKLKIVDILCYSTTRFIANHDAMKDEFKARKISRLALLLRSVLAAEQRVGLMMNVRQADMRKVIDVLPAMRTPTVSPLVDSDWVALNTVIEEHVVRDLVPSLMEIGAEGIVEYPLNKLVE